MQRGNFFSQEIKPIFRHFPVPLACSLQFGVGVTCRLFRSKWRERGPNGTPFHSSVGDCRKLANSDFFAKISSVGNPYLSNRVFFSCSVRIERIKTSGGPFSALFCGPWASLDKSLRQTLVPQEPFYY